MSKKGKNPVSAFELVGALLKTHGYGRRQASSVKLGKGPPDARCRPVAEWLAEIEALVRRRRSEPLDGRDVVFGAALLEPDLFLKLSRADGFLADLEGELRERGTRLTRAGEARLKTLRTPAEVVPTLRDDPATIDQLGREVLAEVLAKRIVRVRRGGPEWVPMWKLWADRARRQTAATDIAAESPGWRGEGQRGFLVHVDAPWGAGKTSLLRFLGKHLRSQRWVVVDFNAWEHQRIVPPWWWLMAKVHEGGKSELRARNDRGALTLWLYDAWWRLRDGWAVYLAVPVAAVAGFFLYNEGFFGKGMTTAGEWAKSAGAVLAFAVAVLGAVRGLNRWVVGGSEGAAASLLRRTRDPMRLVRRRYRALVHAIRQPVAVFVDDLDRCKAEYVVELLEGIQTLFAKEPVVYVVAADGNWVRECYTQVYKDFCVRAAEPGRPLGWLFLEKTFQDTVRLPHIPTSTREDFWRALLSAKPRQRNGDAEEHRREAEAVFEGIGTPAEIGVKMKEAQAKQHIDLRELQRAAALQLESDAVEEHTKHTLDNFAHLLEDNPRAMKKLINAYGIRRDMLVMEDLEVLADETQLRQLALWTITSLRWPVLAEYIEQRPETVDKIRDGTTIEVEDGADGLDRLLREPASVRAVLSGRDVDPPVALDTQVVRRFVGLDDPRTGPLR